MGGCVSTEEVVAGATAENKPQKRPVPDPNTCNTKNDCAGYLVAPRDFEEFRKFSDHDMHVFTYLEMRIATNNFRQDQILGEGGFGFVYKGVIDKNVRPGLEPTQVAIKELNPEGMQGDREWLAEVNYLGQLSHSHLVKLVGYCCEDAHRLLVYEYMAGGSLEKHLFRRASSTMSWSIRMKIALGAAKGLAFLHGAERPIIYRDFKTSNILLDKDYNAKLSDFGLAKDGPMGDQTHVSTRVLGTYGYAAPEYVMTGHLTARSDVYGFGVVLLEMLIGRKALDKSRPSREHNLVEWARPILNHNRRLLRIIDQRLEGQFPSNSVVKAAQLAYVCLSHHPKGRPSMQEAVGILETLQGTENASVYRGIAQANGGTMKDSSPNTVVPKRHSNRTNGERGYRVHRQRRPKPVNERSHTEHRASTMEGVGSKHGFEEFPYVDQHDQSGECELKKQSSPAKELYMEERALSRI